MAAPSHAEQVESAGVEAVAAPIPTKVVRSQSGLQIMVPKKWKSSADGEADRLVFAFDIPNGDFKNFMALRAEQISLGRLLIKERYIPSAEDLVADAWNTVIQPPITPELVATWIMRYNLKSGTGIEIQQPKGPREVNPNYNDTSVSPIKEDQIVDASLTDDGNSKGDAGSELIFHVRTVMTSADVGENRYWTVKALLRGGVITVAYLTTPESFWAPDAPGPYNGPNLDQIVRTLKLKPLKFAPRLT